MHCWVFELVRVVFRGTLVVVNAVGQQASVDRRSCAVPLSVLGSNVRLERLLVGFIFNASQRLDVESF